MKEIKDAWHAFWNAVDSTKWGHRTLVALAPLYVVGALLALAALYGWVVSLLPGVG